MQYAIVERRRARLVVNTEWIEREKDDREWLSLTTA